MFNNVVLDVFIGMVFIFLLYSLLASILQEMLARWLHLRARMLQKGIRRMLEDDNKYSSITLVNAIIEIGFSIGRFFYPNLKSKSNFTKSFFEYPSIKYLAESSWNSKPSYLECGNFSSTVLYMLRGNLINNTSTPQIDIIKSALFTSKQFQEANGTINNIDNETLQQLQKLFIDSNNDIDRFKTNLEKWFNDTMDRATGWYTRQNRLMLFLVGFTIAYSFNVDSIALYGLLSKDKTARESLVQLAISSIPKYDSLTKSVKNITTANKPDTTVVPGKATTIIRDTVSVYVALPDSILLAAQKTIQSDIDKASNIAALGWPHKDSCKPCDSLIMRLSRLGKQDSLLKQAIQDSINHLNTTFHCSGNPYQNKNTRFWGWVLTGLAISMGAPFWFDLLNKLVALRSSNKPKEGDALSSNAAGTNPASSPVKRVG